MSEVKDKCPKCGAASDNIFPTFMDFDCGSVMSTGGKLTQSKGCSRIAELEAALKLPCKNGKHKLIAVYSRPTHDDYPVVRWCEDCGAVVVDIDLDGRTYPGKGMEMRFPAITRAASRALASTEKGEHPL